MDAGALLKQILEHFNRIPYPGDDHIVLDNTGTHLENEEIKQALKGRHWREVPFETLNQMRSALFFLSPEGYRFYLPAFMFYCVTDFYRADIIADEVIQTLIYPSDFDLDRIKKLARRHPEMQPFDSDEWKGILRKIAKMYASGSSEHVFLDRVSGFDVTQCKTIRHFLEHMQVAYGDEFPNQSPQIAIDRYWYQF